MSDPNEYWHRWERFTKYGVKVNGKRYTSTQLLQAWALVLAVLYILLWLSGAVPDVLSLGRLGDSSLEVDEEFWRGRHLVFCISPGRAGSKYLRNVLDTAEGVIARHEPEPKMNGVFLEQVILQGKREETFEERANIKLAAIRDALEGTEPDVVYAETSHMFVKTFSDIILDKLGDVAKISIVFLRRPAREMVWSQLRLGWFSKGHSGKNVWYYDPNDVHPSEKQTSYVTNSSNPIDTLIAYNADVLQRGVELEREVKKRRKERRWRNVRTFETLLLDISGDAAEAGVLKLLTRVGLRADKDKLDLLRQQDRNARDAKKDRVLLGVKREEVDERLEVMKNKLPLLRQVMY